MTSGVPDKQAAPPEGAALSQAKKSTALAVIGFGQFISSAIQSSTAIALPPISAEFGLDITGSSWVMLSLLITTTSLLLIMGRAGDVFGHRRLYTIGYLIIAASSLAGGLAPNAPVLFAVRIVQGVGAAMVFTASPSILATTFQPGERGKALGVLSTAIYIGLTLGPPAGGLLIQHCGWRAIFLVMAPISLLIAVIGRALLPPSCPLCNGRMDWRGAVTLAAGLPALLMAVNQGPAWGWASPATMLCGAAGLLIVLMFLRLENRLENPVLELRLFKSRIFTGSVIGSIANYSALTFSSFLLPFYLIQGLGRTHGAAGLIMSSQPLVMAIFASPAGWLSDKVESRWLTFTGMLIMTAALAGISLAAGHTGTAGLVAWLGVLGMGTGIFISPNTNALLGAAPRDKQGTASGVMAFGRNFGMLLGTSLSAVVFRAAGGSTGEAWEPGDVGAFRTALLFAAGIALAGAAASLMKGNSIKKHD
jgi:EmrB/QacA subfamily drug resistance transporter